MAWGPARKSLGARSSRCGGGACRGRMTALRERRVVDAAEWGGVERVGERGLRLKMRVGGWKRRSDEVSPGRGGAPASGRYRSDGHATVRSARPSQAFRGTRRTFGVRGRRARRADDRRAPRRRASTNIAIAAGESEFTRFDFRDLIEIEAVDVLQPDLAICGGPTEGRRIAALAEAYQLELAPHCWGSALSFSSGMSLAFASPAATVIEYSLGATAPARASRRADRGRGGGVSGPTAPGLA